MPTDNTKTLTKTEQKIVQMMKLAAETGFVCEPVTKFRQEFLTAINSHLVHTARGRTSTSRRPSPSPCSRARPP